MAVRSVTTHAPEAEVMDAAKLELVAGLVVGIPTDTVYALVADVSYTGAADRLFKIKQRSRDHELPVMVSDIEQAMSLTIGVPAAAERLMEKFWPGPLTLVLPRDPELVADLGSDDETIGIRCPDSLIARLLCEDVGPLGVTTANIGGQQPAMTAAEVAERFDESIVPLVLDGGTCNGNLATVVDVTGEVPKLLREGQIPWSDVQTLLAN